MIKWGIIGLGKIAHSFCKDLALVPGNDLLAVASRNEEKAKLFAQTYQAKTYHGSYADLFANPEVEIVYIGTPHNSHHRYAIEAMKAGKHVLCEKPLAVNRSQVAEMIQVAKEEKVFLMEAFWSRFNPAIQAVFKAIEQGKLGNVNYVNADFSFFRDAPNHSRLVNMDLAGGALLDIGIYPIFLAYSCLGMPDQIMATSHFHPNGADMQTAIILKNEKGIASLYSGFRSQSDMTAKIAGTKGSILIDPVWHETEGFRFFQADKKEDIQHFEYPKIGKGYTYEIQECQDCLAKGALESAYWSHQNSLDIIGIMDNIREQIGLKYPFE